MKKWIIWEAEYAEDGAMLYEAETLEAAKQLYIDDTGEPDVELDGEEATAEIIAAHEAEEAA